MLTAQITVTENADATEAAGRALGARLRRGDVVNLNGDLGAGKTVLVRGLFAGSGGDPGLVHSPTFVFHHVYRGPELTLHHIDCYRLGPGADLGFLDLDDLTADGAVVIEWGDYADLTAWNPVRVVIDVADGDRRDLRLEATDRRFAGVFGEAS